MSIRANVDGRRLNERITFLRRTQTRAASGELTETWPALKACWAAVDGEKASEPEASGGVKTLARYTVWVRSDMITRYSITPMDRILWRGKTLALEQFPDQQLRGNLIPIGCYTGLEAA